MRARQHASQVRTTTMERRPNATSVSPAVIGHPCPTGRQVALLGQRVGAQTRPCHWKNALFPPQPLGVEACNIYRKWVIGARDSDLARWRSVGYEVCRTEIIELHRFFEGWFAGTTDDFARFDRSIARDFTMVGPGGDRRTRDEVVRGLIDGHGTRKLAIRIESVEARSLGDAFLLARYEEWLDEKGRVSTALFRERSDAPNGIEWVTVHETWLPSRPG